MKRSSFLLVLLLPMELGLSIVALSQDSVASRPGAPNLQVTTIKRSVDIFRYSDDLGLTTVELRGTALMPKAEGHAQIESVPGGIKMDVHIRGLTAPEKIDPEQLTYILWAVTPDSKATNLGELVLKGKDSTLTMFTSLRSFALMVTAEPYFAVRSPSEWIVVYNVLSNRKNDTIRADLLPIRPSSKLPLHLYEARNAVRIARLAGAEGYASETFRKAVKILQQAENSCAMEARAAGTAETQSREATELAEDARSQALQRQHESVTPRQQRRD